MNWMNMFVRIRGFFGGTATQPVSARLLTMSQATISYVLAQFNRVGSISNFLHLFTKICRK